MTAAASFGVDIRKTDLLPPESFTIARSPRHTAHVITAFFPVTRLVVLQKADPLNPLRRLPGIKLRDDQSDWTTMLRWDWSTIMGPGKKRIFVEEVLKGNVCGPTVILCQGQDKLC